MGILWKENGTFKEEELNGNSTIPRQGAHWLWYYNAS